MHCPDFAICQTQTEDNGIQTATSQHAFFKTIFLLDSMFLDNDLFCESPFSSALWLNSFFITSSSEWVRKVPMREKFKVAT